MSRLIRIDITEADLAEAIAEIRRELSVRHFVYPRQISNGRLTREQADSQTRGLTTARNILTEVARAMKDPATVETFLDFGTEAQP